MLFSNLHTLLAAIPWNVDPEFFGIGSLSIRWYGLLFALSFYVSYLILSRIFSRENVSIETLDKLTLYMVFGTVIGARLGHVLFYDPAYYFSQPVKILMVWEGGLASHGAAIGILITILIFSRQTKLPFLWILDRIAIVVAMAGTFIRTGNLMNSEIVGKQTNVPWAFIFERISLDPVPRHPVQIYEALAYLAIFIVLLGIYIRKSGKFNRGLLFSWFLILVFTARFFIEYFKEPQAAFRETLLMNMGQLLSLPFIIAGIILLIWSQKQSKTSSESYDN